ncbi:MAG: hypothetical protein J5374_02175 [Bacteroidales bacterium]|nr:hypothetical protein [Bacteroidales bacterium]
MESLTDRNIRSALIERYLDAETDVREEALLADYYAGHAPDEDEAAVAKMLLAEHPEALLAAGEQEFGRLAAKCPVRRAPARRPLLWSCAAAAAALALFLLLRPAARESSPFTPLEIAESLNMISNLGLGDIESATAVPSGANILVTVHLKDGTDLPFIMSKDGDTGTLSLASTE